MSSDYENGFKDGFRMASELHSGRAVSTLSGPAPPAPPAAKKKRKASAYSKRYGAAYKRLKAKHPRMSFGALSKKAHKEARRK